MIALCRSMKVKWCRYSWADRIFVLFVYVFTGGALLACLYPLYFTVIASFSNPDAIYLGKVNFWPVDFTLQAYKAVLQEDRIWRGYANSIFYTIAGTGYNLLLTIPAAYAFSKKRMLGGGFLMALFLITMYFGGGLIPSYILNKALGLPNTRMIMILTGGVSVYNVIVTRTYFQNNIPESLYEAARIDGASELRSFFKLALPLSAPIIAVMALYYAVSHWSGYFTAMIYISDEALQPLQIILRRILILNEQLYDELVNADVSLEVLTDAAQRAKLAVTMKFALVFISSAPMLVAYPFVQKHFVKGMMIGSVKG